MKKVYFVGIKGVGMTSLALLLKEAGLDVSGSDVSSIFITDKVLKNAGIPIDEGFRRENIDKFFQNNTQDCLLIYTAAHKGKKNPEVIAGKKKGIPILSLGKAIGELMDGKIIPKKTVGISISGTHGKTTTTALVSFLLQKLGKDPSFLIGTSEVSSLNTPGHFGKDKYLIVEADEYVADISENKPKFLFQHPGYAVITNIDFDHPDVFQNLDEIKKSFSEFIKNIPDNGVVIANIDNKQSMEVVSASGKKYITFGASSEADFRFQSIKDKNNKTHFQIIKNNIFYNCKMSLTGEHNIANATSAIALLDVLGFPPEKSISYLEEFKGTKRRSEKIGSTQQGAIIIDDYAHHPTEIKTTLKGLKKRYNKKIIAIFQSHTYSRTKALLKEFTESFNYADELLLLPVFSSAREKEENTLTERDYISAFKKNNKNTIFFKSYDAVIKYLRDKKYDSKYLIVTIGAGDVYKIGEIMKNASFRF